MISAEFGFQNYSVVNCRSKGDHNDSDWMTLVITNGQAILPPQKLLLGDNLHAGDQVGDGTFGPFVLDEHKLITVTYSVVNLRQSDNQDAKAAAFGLALAGGIGAVTGGGVVLAGEIAKDELLKIAGAITGLVGGVASTIGGIIGVSDSDPACDGEVFTRVFTFLPGELQATNQSIPPSGQFPIVETARNRPECGQDPHTNIRYHFNVKKIIHVVHFP
jgi:hypothetical protein